MPIKHRLEHTLSKAPFKVLVPFFYLIYFLSVLLWILVLPLFFVYRLALCGVAWFLMKPGKDVLVVTNAPGDLGPWLSQVIPLIESRAVFLSYEERRKWPRRSLAVSIFHAFGPTPIPPSFMPRCLPALILIRKFRAPRQFSFGEISRDREVKLKKLSSALASSPSAENKP
jgi:hypothetical protein